MTNCTASDKKYAKYAERETYRNPVKNDLQPTLNTSADHTLNKLFVIHSHGFYPPVNSLEGLRFLQFGNSAGSRSQNSVLCTQRVCVATKSNQFWWFCSNAHTSRTNVAWCYELNVRTRNLLWTTPTRTDIQTWSAVLLLDLGGHPRTRSAATIWFRYHAAGALWGRVIAQSWTSGNICRLRWEDLGFLRNQFLFKGLRLLKKLFRIIPPTHRLGWEDLPPRSWEVIPADFV